MLRAQNGSAQSIYPQSLAHEGGALGALGVRWAMLTRPEPAGSSSTPQGALLRYPYKATRPFQRTCRRLAVVVGLNGVRRLCLPALHVQGVAHRLVVAQAALLSRRVAALSRSSSNRSTAQQMH